MTPAIEIERWNSKRFGGVGCPKLAMRTRRLQVGTIHCTAGSEKIGARRNVCTWWDDPRAGGNAHHVIDAGGIVEFAPDNRVAWHASQANSWSKGYEFCGLASQTRAAWLDDLSTGGLRLGAQLMARDAITYGWEVRWLTDEELLAIHAGNTALTGFTDHATIDRVWKKKSPHWDPGPDFPTVDLLLAVRGYVELWSSP